MDVTWCYLTNSKSSIMSDFKTVKAVSHGWHIYVYEIPMDNSLKGIIRIMNCLDIGSFYYFCYLYLVLNFMLAVCESWCGNFSGHLSNTCRFSWELIYNLINKRNILVNYEHIISFLRKSILPFSFFVNSKHAIKVVLILIQRRIW